MTVGNLEEPIEIEIKFYLKHPQETRNRIQALGAKRLGRHFETNIRFEDPAHRLAEKNSLLRLRKDTKTTLTFKSEHPGSDNEFKILNELEVEVNDFEMMHRILVSLGFHRKQVYEKWRETFRIEDAILCIDQMPYGNFLEIEGSRDKIKELAKDLLFDWKRRIRWNYLAMFESLRQQYHLTFTDVTFHNFRAVHTDIEEQIRHFEG